MPFKKFRKKIIKEQGLASVMILSLAVGIYGNILRPSSLLLNGFNLATFASLMFMVLLIYFVIFD